MKRNNERRRESEHDVKIEPVPGNPLTLQPRPPFADGVEEDDAEHARAQDSELQSDGAAGLQLVVLEREGPILQGKPVVIESVDGKRKYEGDREYGSDRDANAVAAAQQSGIRRVNRDLCRNGLCAHLAPVPSSVLATIAFRIDEFITNDYGRNSLVIRLGKRPDAIAMAIGALFRSRLV